MTEIPTWLLVLPFVLSSIGLLSLVLNAICRSYLTKQETEKILTRPRTSAEIHRWCLEQLADPKSEYHKAYYLRFRL